LAYSRLFVKNVEKIYQNGWARWLLGKGLIGKGLMSDIDLSSLFVRAQTGDRTAYDSIVHRF